MKYGLICLIIVMAFILNAQNDQEDFYAVYNQYRDNPSLENISAAIEFYGGKSAEDSQAALILSYVYLDEMDKNIAILTADLDSLRAGTKFSFANLLLALGRYDESIVIYEILNEDTPDWSCPWRHKGEALMKSAELQKAEAALLKAIETRIEHYDAYVMLAEVQEGLNKPAEALKTLEMGLSYRGKDIEEEPEGASEIEVMFLYLDLLKQNDRTEDFERIKAKIASLVPDDPRLKEE